MNNLKALTIKLLFLNPNQIAQLGEVTSPIVMEGSSNEFNRNGLFSTEIFGKVSTEQRNITFAYISLNADIIHPLIFKHIISLSSLHLPILEGRKYAIFNKKTKMFEESNISEGDTGYGFFVNHIHELDYIRNESKSRKYKIDMIEKYKKQNKLLLQHFLVLPAGLRDYIVDENGRPQEDEVNDLYRRLLGSSKLLNTVSKEIANSSVMSPTRMSVQKVIQEIYTHFMKLLDGKNKFIQSKFVARATSYGTRNVLTGLPAKIKTLNTTDRIMGVKHVTLGLYQYSKAIAPLAKSVMKSKVLNHIFSPYSDNAYLTNVKTLETKVMDVPATVKDSWLSDDGLEGILNKIHDDNNLSEPCLIGDYAIAMIYDDNVNIKLVVDTNTLPEGRDKKHLRPITYSELLYLSLIDGTDDIPVLATRYPVTGQGSIFPAITYLKTTTVGRKVNVLNAQWETHLTVNEYPILSERFYVSMSVPHNALNALGGDFDGRF